MGRYLVACRVPSQSAVVGPCSRGEANTSPGKGGLVPPQGAPLPAPDCFAEEQHWDALGVSWPRGVPSCCCTPVHRGDAPVSWSRSPARRPSGSTAFLFPVVPAGMGAGASGTQMPPSVSGHLPGSTWLGKSLAQCFGTLVMCQGPLSQLWPGSGRGGEGISRHEPCLLHSCAPSPLSQGTWMMPVPLPAGASLGNPPAPSSLCCPRLPTAWPSRSGPRALPIPNPCPLVPLPTPEPWLPVLETWCRPLPRHVPVLSACLLM